MSNCSKCKSKLIPVGFNPELGKTVDRLYCIDLDLVCIDCLINGFKRAEAAEARADTCAEMIETLVNEKAQAEADAADLLKVYREQKETIKTIEAERDEARRQLSEAQRAIDVLSNTVVAQNATIKRLEQAREDVAEYRAEIARLNQAATA